MKSLIKIGTFLLAVMLLWTSCGKTPQTENKLSENDKILSDCVFKAESGKYGIQRDGKIVFEAVYDTFETVGNIGEKTLYALGKNDETEKMLYEFFFDDASLILSLPMESYEFLPSENNSNAKLYTSLEGDFYTYEFSNEGEIIADSVDSAGRTGKKLNGLYEIQYYNNASPLSKVYGLEDENENKVLNTEYSYIEAPFEDRFVAVEKDSMTLEESDIFDISGNLICGKYNKVDFYKIPNSEKYIGIAYCIDPQGQNEPRKDENGEAMQKGYRFIDKDGNELSEVFETEIIFDENKISDGKYMMTLTDADKNQKETDIISIYAFNA